MGRIVVNKHFDKYSSISDEKFVNKGELIISNQVGFEGIAIINTDGNIVFISPTSGTSSDIPADYKTFVAEYVTGELSNYFTSAQTITLIEASGGTVSEELIQEVLSGTLESYITTSALTEALSPYITVEAFNSALTEYVTAESVSSMTSDFITSSEVINLISANTITEEEVQSIAAIEVAKIVASADTSFDTLKEIADWIINDETGSAQMANDIAELKAQLNALVLGAKATISVSPKTIYAGVDTVVSITGKMVPETLTPCEVYLYRGGLNGELISSSNTPTVTFSENVLTSTTYAVKAVYNGTPYTATDKVSSYYPTYYGFGVDYIDVVTNGTKALKSSAKTDYVGTSNADGVYYFIIVPNGVSVPTSFTMGGAPFNMESTTQEIDGISYTVIKSGSIFNNGGKVNISAK